MRGGIVNSDNQALIETVARARQGDTRAFDCLVRQFQDRAVAYARTLLFDPQAAEDAAQEAFVQAWRDLPRLTEAEAFGGWLRRIVFKFCDRARRSARPTLPLLDALSLSGEWEPERIVERAEEAAQVHTALDRLPPLQRETALLYYFTGLHVQEVAAFLDVPPSTVKNRLHSARKRLRKDLETMIETVLTEERPSQKNEFADKVLSRVLAEFHAQEKADPHTVNRGLLDTGRDALFSLLNTGQGVRFPVLQEGFMLLWRKWDFAAMSALLGWTVAQNYTDSQKAWAYLHLANSIAMTGSAAGAVMAHENFENWASGRTLALSHDWPCYPVEDKETSSAYRENEVRLLFLSQSCEFTTAYLGISRNDDYLKKVDAALAAISPSLKNIQLRFYAYRMASNACEAAGDFARSAHYVAAMHRLADEETTEAGKARRRGDALGHNIILARKMGDESLLLEKANEMIDLLAAGAKQGENESTWLRGERHNLATELHTAGKYDLSLPLWDANAATGGQLNGWGYLVHAATVWQVTRDKKRTLSLLREARAHDDRDMVPLFTECKEFADVINDTNFVSAIRREK